MSSPETISGSWRRRPGSMGAPSWFRVPRWLTRSGSGMAGRIVPSAICTMPRGCPLLPSAATIGEMQQCRHRSLRGDLRVSAQSCPQERRPASRKKLQSRPPPRFLGQSPGESPFICDQKRNGRNGGMFTPRSGTAAVASGENPWCPDRPSPESGFRFHHRAVR